MVLCKKCGADNQLGRVFCSACGAKLDLRNMSSSAMAARKPAIPWLKILLPKFIAVLAVLVLLPVALALWPQPQPIGKKGSKIGGQRVIGALQAMTYLGRGATLGRSFSEEDLNGYFEYFKAQKLNAESISVRVAQGYFVVRVVRAIGPWNVGPYKLNPRVSQELICVPAGSRLSIDGAAIGHLTWLGPFQTSVASRLYRLVAAEPEWAIFQNLAEMRAEPGRISVSVKRN